MKRALISVSNKAKVTEFARELTQLGYQILSTGGTAKAIKEAGIEVTLVSDVTKFPEIMNGRVKTLHPKIHGGILADRDIPSHLIQAKELEIGMIDIVAVNLYPFEQTLKSGCTDYNELIEKIDIGGPTMVRSAAKNHKYVAVITDSDDYETVIEELKKSNEISFETKKMLATKAFLHTAKYDTAISNWLQNQSETKRQLQVSACINQELRYGENPHQQAEFYQNEEGIINQLHGKQLSYNNYIDIDAALKIIEKFDDEPAVAIIKHTNPSGIATGSNLVDAYQKAFATDTLSPFGGIVVVNKPLDLKAAEEINKVFTEIILAPEYTEDAYAKLIKKKNRRLLTYDIVKVRNLSTIPSIKSCLDGYLQQETDMNFDDYESWKVVTDRKPTESELKALKFGWKAVATLKSNAVCFCADDRTLGLGIGQTSRIDSSEIALSKAKKFNLDLKNCICASDAFFPFRDSVDAIAPYGIKAIIQPGGSKGDEEVIKACNEHGIAMIFTGMRHFRH